MNFFHGTPDGRGTVVEKHCIKEQEEGFDWTYNWDATPCAGDLLVVVFQDICYIQIITTNIDQTFDFEI